MTQKEKPAQRLETLLKEVELTKKEIQDCDHKYSVPVRTTRTIKVPEFDHYEGHGSDPEPVYNWHDKTEHGYERTCEVCGKMEYTNQTKPVIERHEPDFGGAK